MRGLSWPELHGALTHFPVALLIMACAFEIGAALFRKAEWRIVSFWILVGAVVLAIPSLATGWITGGMLFAGPAQPPALFSHHRLAAFVTSALAVILLVWRIATHDRLAGIALTASVILAAI